MANVSKFAFDEEIEALEIAEWLEAKTMTAEMSPEQIYAWVTCTPDGRYKTSMRSKLNYFRKKNNDNRKNAKRNQR